MLDEHQTAHNALTELPRIAKLAGVKDYQPYSYAAAERELDAGLHAGYTPLFLGDPAYPPLLCETPDAPPFLWALGDTNLLQMPIVSLVGARNSSSTGRRMAAQLAKGLGQLGYVVGSGLARGIDAAAHAAALDTGTIAVHAGGLDVIYPRENTELASDIAQDGLCLSEQPIGLVPQARHFPQRNRIVAGVARAVVVIEGAARSGSLITARCAADLGRDVMAVPGNPLDGRAAGCNMLIRDGATLIRSAKDIHEALRHPIGNTPRSAQPELPLSHQATPKTPAPDFQISERILTLLTTTGIAEDVVIRDVGLPAPEVTRQLTALELQGLITRSAGGKLALAC